MTKRSVLNLLDVDPTKEPMFFGNGLGLQRYDKVKYPRIKQFAERQRLYYWSPEEIELSKDKLDFINLSDADKHIYTKNLQYQILLDSVQGRALIETVGKYNSLNELESCINSWQFFENIHSLSYTHIINNVYDNPSKIFDDIKYDNYIINRASSVVEYYNELLNIKDTASLKEKWEYLYLTLISINILEGIRFYTSFACSFAFAEEDKMLQSAKILGLISRDEQIHLQMSQYIINLLKTSESNYILEEVIAELEPKVISMYEQAYNDEIEWANYLFKEGSSLRLNVSILTNYIGWLTNVRLAAIGINHEVQAPKQNPINWINKYLNSSNVQAAPQEIELTSYLTRGLDKSKLTNLKGFKL